MPRARYMSIFSLLAEEGSETIKTSFISLNYSVLQAKIYGKAPHCCCSLQGLCRCQVKLSRFKLETHFFLVSTGLLQHVPVEIELLLQLQVEPERSHTILSWGEWHASNMQKCSMRNVEPHEGLCGFPLIRKDYLKP